jgi:hypothetical protein
VRKIGFAILLSGLVFAVSCGGSGGSSPTTPTTPTTITSTPGGNTIVSQGAANVAPLIVDAGPASIAASYPSENMAFTIVTVCGPNGSTTCVTIDHVAVDTGSVGLRILSSAVSTLTNGPAVLAALPNVNTSTPVAECYPFVLNYAWGSVRSADVKMGGTNNNSEVATAVPILVMDDTSIPSAPSSCTSQTVGSEMNSVLELGANGLLGVGNYQYDCDVPGAPTGSGSNTYGIGANNGCASSSGPPTGTYYTCSGGNCIPSTHAILATQQVRNPVSMFTTDNNGVILELPAVPSGGLSGISVNQSALVFGIGTASNNGLNSSAVVLPIDSNYNDNAYLGITTVFNGVSYPNPNSTTYTGYGGYLDSGSNANYFLDSPTTGITDCPTNYDYYYCPNSTETFTAVNQSASGNKSQFQFNVSKTGALSGGNTAFSDLAGPNTANPTPSEQASDAYFDWGLPFFYGRNVYTAIWGVTPPSGVPAGPFWAY